MSSGVALIRAMPVAVAESLAERVIEFVVTCVIYAPGGITAAGTITLATAPVPPPPENAMVGSLVKPLPAAVTLMAVTAPPETVAVAVAPVPPPPLITTVGAEV
jgi:hypothetical protein